MEKFRAPPGLEGLFDLDRKGVDIRPTLLRVLTDQYLRTPIHTPAEERHYTELAMRLLDETDIATRAAVSVRLAPHACAPRTIMLQLACDVLEVAEPVLLHSPVLTPEDCQKIIVERGVCYADILARRGKPAAKAATPEPAPAPHIEAVAVMTAPAAAPATAVAPPAAPSPPSPPVVAVAEDDTCEEPAPPRDEPAEDGGARELCELFFAAGSAERRLILMNLDYADWPAGEPPAPLQRADVWRMETAALRHNTATVMRELERTLRISYQQSRRIVEDELGEPIVIAGKAMSLPADVLQRIVLFLNPRVGQSIDRVYELAALYNEISVEAASRLVSILRAAEPADEQKTRDARAIHGEEETARRTSSDVAATPTAIVRKPDAVLRRAAGEG